MNSIEHAKGQKDKPLDKINGVGFYKLIEQSLRQDYSDLIEDGFKRATAHNFTPQLTNRNYGAGSISELPKDIKFSYDSPSNDPIKYRDTYLTHMRYFSTTYVVCENYLRDGKFENPITLFFDGVDTYEIIAGTHRCLLFRCLEDVKIQANIFYRHGFEPKELELSEPYPFEVYFENNIKNFYRFNPVPTVYEDFNYQYLHDLLEFIESLKDMPQLHFYCGDSFMFQSPSRSKDIYRVNLYPGETYKLGLMQFVLDYFFDITDFRNKKFYDYEKAS